VTVLSAAQGEMMLLATARVRDIDLKSPLYVEAADDVVSVCRALSAASLTHALVRDGERLGIFTTTDLRDALLRDVPPAQLAVRELAHFDVVSVSPDTELVEALWLMVRHRVHRLLVRDGAAVLGIVGQLDLVGVVANHSHIVARQIDEARSVDDLRFAAQRIDATVELLHDSGIRVERIARLVSEMNGRLFARLWSLVAPADLVAASSLLVMGSEGRGEQILKTDQDNALLLRDGFEIDEAELAAVARRFNDALAEFGYPLCPGDIMLTNPLWRQPLAGFRTSMREWLYGQGGGSGGPEVEGPMRLAIFFDARTVAGDAGLLDEARRHLDALLSDNDAFLARFARAADQFGDGNPWWTRLGWRRDEQAIDLKKLGTFPIVHGVRALSLEHQVRAASTVDRLRQLVAGHHVDADLARDLEQALHFVMALRLKHQLRQRHAGEPPTNLVKPSDLDTLEREPLQDSLAIVKRFRAFLTQHFRLDSL
jgi:CBS domain-containing protein